MKLDINFWNIHCWLLQRDIPHMYIFEDELEPFSGIRFFTLRKMTRNTLQFCMMRHTAGNTVLF